jgi:putative PEP-CTERM system TPR-repeat lipoprotein
VNLVSTLIALNQLNEAATELATLRKRLPQDPRARYMEALIAYRKGDLAKAREEVQQVLRVAPDNLPTLVLAGSVEYGLGAFASAETYLRRVVSAVPKAVQPRVMLAATYLRTGQPGKAEDTLEPIMKSYPNEPTLLRLAGEIALANGRADDALSLYNRASAVSEGKNEAELRTRAAQMRLATGDTERALRDLEKISTVDAGNYQADLALVAAHLGKRDYEKALQSVASLEKKQPENPLTYNTRGIVLVNKQDIPGARAAFEKALSLQPNYLPAAKNLASLDFLAKQPDAAKGRFEAILAKEPTNQGALLSLAETQARAGAPPKEIAATLDRAINAGPQSAAARIALINLHLANRDVKAATTVAQAAAIAIPDNPRILDVLGGAQLAAGETNQAIATFNKLVDVTNAAPPSLLRLANAQFVAKDYSASSQTLRRVIEARPDFVDAYRQMAMVQIAAGRPDEALKEARGLQKTLPKSGAGAFLEGEILSSQKRHKEAAAAYAQSVKVQPLPLVVSRQYDALIAAGQPKEAEALASRWLRENPKDPLMRIFLADREIRDKDYREAAKLYREVIAIQPENVIALNNLAWTLHESGDPSAVTYAERAYKLAGNNPGVADTYGWILVQGGDPKRGVELLTQASAAAPNAPEIKLRLAKGLLKTGDRAGAKAQLESIAKLDQPSNAKTEAQQLLKSL